MFILHEDEFYEVTGINIRGDLTTASWKVAGPVNPADPVSDSTITIPNAAITGDTQTAVMDWLSGNDGPFPDGEYMVEAEYNLRVAQVAMRAAILARRIQLEEGGLATSFGVVDSDANSQRKISGGVQMALLSLNTTNTISSIPFATAFFPTGFELIWRFSDNSTMALTAEQMVQLGVETGKQVAQYQMVKNYFDALVMGATTVAEVEAVDIDVNWLTVDPTPAL